MTSVRPTLTQIQMALAAQAPTGHPMRDYEPKERAKRGKPKQPERELQEAVCQYLGAQSIFHWANNPQVFTGKMTPAKLGYLASLKRRGFKKGTPDICCLLRNRYGATTFLALELKAAKGVVSEEQQAFMDRVNDKGGYSAVVRSVEDVIAALLAALG